MSMRGRGIGWRKALAPQKPPLPARQGNRRRRALAAMALTICLLACLTIAGAALAPQAAFTDFSRKNLPPSLAFPFGTDWMGRDMFVRTLIGLSMSIRMGLLTAAVSTCIALLIGSLAASLGRAADAAVCWLIDLMMGVPHMLLLILIAFVSGKGLRGVIIGITLTHWMSLARLLRAETLQVTQSLYVKTARKLGHGSFHILLRHIAPQLLPQCVVGLVLLFPHAILHEASITFLGFGLAPEQPAIGIILSESMRHLATGRWWLALFPGLALVSIVALFDLLGRELRGMLDPASSHG